MLKQKVIAVVGPTASGKSALGAYLTQKIGGEIISADSRQVYRGMRVISRAEPAHMVGVKDPRRVYSSGEFVKDAEKIIAQISARGKVPVLVGGAGFYTDALLGKKRPPEVPPNTKLRAKLAKKTAAQLYAQLQKADPTSATRVDPNNHVRLVRALEIAAALGSVPPLVEQTQYDVLWLGLRPTHATHATAIRKGVVERLHKGMVREARKLRTSLPKKRFKELGFEFELLAAYLDKEITKKELVEKLVRGEAQYAIRQMRWFKRNPRIHWVKNKAEALRLTKAFLS